MIKYENFRAENRNMAENISIPDTKSGNNLKSNRLVKEILIPDIRHILLKYKKNKCKNKKNGGGDLNFRFKTYKDEI